MVICRATSTCFRYALSQHTVLENHLFQLLLLIFVLLFVIYFSTSCRQHRNVQNIELFGSRMKHLKLSIAAIICETHLCFFNIRKGFFIGLNAGDFFFFFTCAVRHCSNQNDCLKAKKNAFDYHILFDLYYLLIYFTFKLLQSEWTSGRERER